VSGCVADGAGGLPLPIGWEQKYKPLPRAEWGWSDQKKMEFRTPKNPEYTGPKWTTVAGGQKIFEGNYKDGKWDGLIKGWHDNGQKMFEGTYIDGTKIIARYWNIEGIEVENLDEARGWGVYRKSD
jgi:antitoxin component YwqK of YwqJK toxin-antitoxin module